MQVLQSVNLFLMSQACDPFEKQTTEDSGSEQAAKRPSQPGTDVINHVKANNTDSVHSTVPDVKDSEGVE